MTESSFLGNNFLLLKKKVIKCVLCVYWLGRFREPSGGNRVKEVYEEIISLEQKLSASLPRMITIRMIKMK